MTIKPEYANIILGGKPNCTQGQILRRHSTPTNPVGTPVKPGEMRAFDVDMVLDRIVPSAQVDALRRAIDARPEAALCVTALIRRVGESSRYRLAAWKLTERAEGGTLTVVAHDHNPQWPTARKWLHG